MWPTQLSPDAARENSLRDDLDGRQRPGGDEWSAPSFVARSRIRARSFSGLGRVVPPTEAPGRTRKRNSSLSSTRRPFDSFERKLEVATRYDAEELPVRGRDDPALDTLARALGEELFDGLARSDRPRAELHHVLDARPGIFAQRISAKYSSHHSLLVDDYAEVEITAGREVADLLEARTDAARDDTLEWQVADPGTAAAEPSRG